MLGPSARRGSQSDDDKDEVAGRARESGRRPVGHANGRATSEAHDGGAEAGIVGRARWMRGCRRLWRSEVESSPTREPSRRVGLLKLPAMVGIGRWMERGKEEGKSSLIQK